MVSRVGPCGSSTSTTGSAGGRAGLPRERWPVSRPRLGNRRSPDGELPRTRRFVDAGQAELVPAGSAELGPDPVGVLDESPEAAGAALDGLVLAVSGGEVTSAQEPSGVVIHDAVGWPREGRGGRGRRCTCGERDQPRCLGRLCARQHRSRPTVDSDCAAGEISQHQVASSARVPVQELLTPDGWVESNRGGRFRARCGPEGWPPYISSFRFNRRSAGAGGVRHLAGVAFQR